MENNKSEVISIESINSFDYGVKIIAHNKKTYTVPRKKKDGATTVAWKQMLDMELKGSNPVTGVNGSVVEVWFREVPNKYGGTTCYISSFKETSDSPSMKTETLTYEKDNNSKEEFWDKKAYKQCLWNYWLEQQPKGIMGEGWENIVWAVFNQIEKDADERFSKPKGWAELGQKLKIKQEEKVEPVIFTDEEINVEDIPF